MDTKSTHGEMLRRPVNWHAPPVTFGEDINFNKKCNGHHAPLPVVSPRRTIPQPRRRSTHNILPESILTSIIPQYQTASDADCKAANPPNQYGHLSEGRVNFRIPNPESRVFSRIRLWRAMAG